MALPTLTPMTHTLMLDIATGALTVRRTPRHHGHSEPGTVRLCPSPHLTARGLRVLTVDHASQIADVLDAEEAGEAATALDTLGQRIMRDLASPGGQMRFERIEDWTRAFMEDVEDRGITAETPDADLARMAEDDLTSLRESTEVPGAFLIRAPGLLRGYRAHRDTLRAAHPAPVDATPPPAVAPAETAPAPVRAVSADAARLHVLADTPGVWPEASTALRVLATPATATWAASHMADDGRMDWLALRLDAATQTPATRRVFAVALSLLSPVETISLRDLHGTLDPDAATALTDYLTRPRDSRSEG